MNKQTSGVEDIKEILSKEAKENHLSSEKGEGKVMVADPTGQDFAGISVSETVGDDYLITVPDNYRGPEISSFNGTEGIQQTPEYSRDLAKGLLRMTDLENNGYEVENLGDGFYEVQKN